MFSMQDDGHEQSRASPKDQVSMPFIKRHIRRRLTNAKDTCDKELRKVIESITQHVEHRLREPPQATPPLDSPGVHHGHSNSGDHALDDSKDDDADFLPDHHYRHSRRVSTSASSSPNSLRRHRTLPKTHHGELSPGKNLSQANVGTTPSSSSASYAQSGVSRRLSRNMHIPIMPTRSGSNSRSTSRSRSPLPSTAAEMSTSPRSSSGVANKRASRLDLDSVSAHFTPNLFMATLHEVIAIATDILDTPISKLIMEPRLCAEFVQKVQKVGRAWDEHSDWHGRGWYVQLLLAVAGLSRVVEWWEAEKQFWNFEEDDDQEVEPLTFVLKPDQVASPTSATGSSHPLPPENEEFSLGSDHDGSAVATSKDGALMHEVARKPSTPSFSGIGATNTLAAPSESGPVPLASSRAASAKPSREPSMERIKPSVSASSVQIKTSADEQSSSPEASRVQATEKLRIQAEEAQSSNIVMEIGLDREEILWVNQAWVDVVGTTWEEIAGISISDLLHPEDAQVFKDATKQLQHDDSHTIEAQFRVRVEPASPTSDEETASSDSTTSALAHRQSSRSPLSRGTSIPAIYTPSISHLSLSASACALAPFNTPPESQIPPPRKPMYRIFEGKGMLMLDRITGQPTHTMWVMKPVSALGYFDGDTTVLDMGDLTLDPTSALSPASVAGFHRRVSTDPITPFVFSQPISVAPILCRICECSVPEWYFEKHNETCNEVHKLEAAIGECNESISELRNTIRDVLSTLDKEKERGFTSSGSSSSVNSLPTVPEYRGVPIFSPRSAPPSPSMLSIGQSLHIFRPQLGASRKKKKLQGVRQLQRSLLEQLDEALCLAFEICIPAVKEDQANQPMERQRLLSPNSIDRIEQLKQWKKPMTSPSEEDDPALARLVLDVQLLLKAKLESVNRMENTVRYTEKIRQEWEARVEHALVNMEMEMEMDDLPEEDEGDEGGDENGSHSSTKSEYAYDGEEPEGSNASSFDPTPGPCSPNPEPILRQRSRSASRVSALANAASNSGMPSAPQGLGLSSPVVTASPQPILSSAVPATYTGIGSHYTHTRSSTPSSISSPLALAAPINASAGPDSVLFLPAAQIPLHSSFSTQSQTTPPPLGPPPIADSAQTIRPPRLSQHLGSLEPKLLVTPPISPLVSPRDVPATAPIATTGSGHSHGSSHSHGHGHSRRQSVIHPTIISPSASLVPSSGPLSPRLPSITPSSRTTPSSIKDFDIIKPISKGAFGAVFLAKKKTTGDYYAIKVLKKADMIAKNQITNVKAERMILMKQAESPFVVKLYFTFQSKDNLYLVMEYLNGGDCAALIKSLGSLPEEWTRAYVAEVTLGLEYLHARDVVHRDLKPDNLLIDQHGHLKLTDFGLSRIGLLGRQARDRATPGAGLDRVSSLDRNKKRQSSSSRQASVDSTYLASPLASESGIPSSLASSYFGHRTHSNLSTDDISESSGSESLAGQFMSKSTRNFDSPLQSFASELATDLRSHSHSESGTPPGERRFVGTPDYLAPESILGISEVDRAVDWWALGVITYEFLYGIPPFHDETPERVFENIISRKIEWHEDWVDFSKETMDFMDKLMQIDPKKRLGWNGASEVREHPFLAEVEWDKVTTTEAQFVPQVEDPESTDYFDPRGAIPQLFQDEDAIAVAGRPGDSPVEMTGTPGSAYNFGSGTDDFGAFNFKNLPVLKQANDDVIRKLKTEQAVAMTHTLSDPVSLHRRRSVSVRKPPHVLPPAVADPRILTNPPSPSTSTSSIASSPSRISLPPSTPGSTTNHNHNRRPSEFGPLERFKQSHMDNDGTRRNSLPSRLRTSSMSSMEQEGQIPEHWRHQVGTPPSSVASVELKKTDEFAPTRSSLSSERPDRAVTCLIAEDNPISVKIIETLLTRMGCRCVLVHDGAEAISVALGEIKFDVILMDHHMPIMDGETAARYIKSTNNKNKNTPIISVSAYTPQDGHNTGNLFAASLAKPVQKADIVGVMRQLGFKMVEGPKGKVAR